MKITISRGFSYVLHIKIKYLAISTGQDVFLLKREGVNPTGASLFTSNSQLTRVIHFLNPKIARSLCMMIEWKAVYLSPFKCTKISKLLFLQLLRRRHARNSLLKKIGIKETDLCTFCKTKQENLIHLLVLHVVPRELAISNIYSWTLSGPNLLHRDQSLVDNLIGLFGFNETFKEAFRDAVTLVVVIFFSLRFYRRL